MSLCETETIKEIKVNEVTKAEKKIVKLAEFPNVKLIFDQVVFIADKQTLSKLDFFSVLFKTKVGSAVIDTEDGMDTFKITAESKKMDLCFVITEFFTDVIYGEQNTKYSFYKLYFLNIWQGPEQLVDKYKKSSLEKAKKIILDENNVWYYNDGFDLLEFVYPEFIAELKQILFENFASKFNTICNTKNKEKIEETLLILQELNDPMWVYYVWKNKK